MPLTRRLLSLTLLVYTISRVVTAISNNATGNGTSIIFVSPTNGTNTTSLSTSVILRLRDCHEYLMAGFKVTGAYKIYPFGDQKEGFYVYCDMDSDGGGWTVIQTRRIRGTYRNSFQSVDTDYSKQFGSTCGDGWIGMDALSELTSRNDQQVQFYFTLWQQDCAYCGWSQHGHQESFKKFWIGSSAENYRISVSDYYAGENGLMFQNVNGLEFFTRDLWQQKCPNKTFTAPGWYNSTTCTTPLPYNLFGSLDSCPSSQSMCATEIKIRNPLGSILLDGEWMSFSSVKDLFETFKRVPRDCVELFITGNTTSGAYRIFPTRQLNKFIYVYCDMSTDGGGWTTVLQRGKYQVQQESFDLSWAEYESGFGSTCADQLIGLGDLFTLCSVQKNELRIVLTDWDGIQAYANYKLFAIGTSTERYPLIIGNYSSGTAGDSLSVHSGARFTTRDQDQDAWVNGNCAEVYGGAWWYVNCLSANLNGLYLNKTTFAYGQGIVWSSWKGFNYSMKSVEMKIRNNNFDVLKKLVSLM